MVRTRRVSGAGVASRRHVLRGPGYFKRARSKAVLGRHRSGLLSQLLVGAAAVVMAALSVLAVLR